MSLTFTKKKAFYQLRIPLTYTQPQLYNPHLSFQRDAIMMDFPAQIFQLFPPTALNELVRVGPQKCIKRWNPLC